MWETPAYYDYFSVMKIYEIDIWPRTVGLNWITGLATIFLAYSCHPIFYYLRGELRSKTDARVSKVIKYSITIECVLYIAIGIAGYVSLGNNLVPDVFFLRKAIRKCLKFKFFSNWSSWKFRHFYAGD
jgi:amino acid permease